MISRRKKRRYSGRKGIDSERALAEFCRQVARKYRLNTDRLRDLYDILREALYASTNGSLSTRKAISLTLRFLGNTLAVIE